MYLVVVCCLSCGYVCLLIVLFGCDVFFVVLIGSRCWVLFVLCCFVCCVVCVGDSWSLCVVRCLLCVVLCVLRVVVGSLIVVRCVSVVVVF